MRNASKKEQTLQVEYRPIASLTPYARNARTHSDTQVAQIAASIKEFGFNNPVLVREGQIVAGHGRWLAAQRLGLGQVPTLDLSHLTASQARAYVLADNQLALNAGWDSEMLALELLELRDDGVDLGLLGFEDVDALMNPEPAGGLQPGVDEDAVPEPPKKAITKLGDVITLGRHRLMCGDSTNADDVARLMGGAKADMVFTDPPYGVEYEGGHNKKKRGQIKGDALEGSDLTGLFYDSLAIACANTHDHAAFYVWFASGKSVETFAAFGALPLDLRAVLQWYKVRSGLGAFMAQYIPNAEPCIYAFKKGCSPQWFGPSDEKTVWELQREGANEYHPTQKPVALAERAVANSSQPGQTVLDLFGGSGSTMIACEKTGRTAYLMELDPIYCDVIVTRWEQATGRKAVRDGSL